MNRELRNFLTGILMGIIPFVLLAAVLRPHWGRPPEPLPPIPDEHPGLEAAFRAVIGLYRNEIVKDSSDRACRAAVRKENAEAARKAGSD